MAISRRLRFEILRRDEHTCRYCGARAPDVELTVDHVVPVALGGADTADNLVAACRDCNAGKSSIPPGSPLVDQVAADALRWARAMEEAAAIQADDRERRQAYVDRFDAAWVRWTYDSGQPVSRPADWRSTVGRFCDRGLAIDELVALVDDVLPRGIADSRMWAYFNGAVRNVMLERERIARELLEQEEEAERERQAVEDAERDAVERADLDALERAELDALERSEQEAFGRGAPEPW